MVFQLSKGNFYYFNCICCGFNYKIYELCKNQGSAQMVIAKNFSLFWFFDIDGIKREYLF